MWCSVLYFDNCDQFRSHVCVVRTEIISNGHQRKSNKNSILGISFLVNLSNVKKFCHINRRKTKYCLPSTLYDHFHYYINNQHTKVHEILHTPHEDCFAWIFQDWVWKGFKINCTAIRCFLYQVHLVNTMFFPIQLFK